MTDKECPLIILSSGQSMKMKTVSLYDEKEVQAIAALKAEAINCLGGVSSGIGFIGSPEWVIGGSIALGIVEGLISGSKKKEGVELLRRAQVRSEKLAKSGVMIDASEINNSHVPDPRAWYSVKHTTVYVDNPENKRLKELVKKQPMYKSIVNLEDEKMAEVTEKKYVHNGDDFVIIGSDLGLISIRWSDVVAYRPIQPRPD